MLPRETQSFVLINLSSPGTLLSPRPQEFYSESRSGTDQHDKEDEDPDLGHAGARLQDDTDDPGQGLHRHAHMHQPKNPEKTLLAPQPYPSTALHQLSREAELNPSWEQPSLPVLGIQSGHPLFQISYLT